MNIMKITSASFAKGVLGTDAIINDTSKPHIAFVGRSNVGKSSVINALLSRKNLARSSSSPGKTREINFFLINEQFYFVDLPGYGYAKVPDKEKEKLVKHIAWYLFEAAAPIALVFVIIDASVGPSEKDLEMIKALVQGNVPFVVLGNKIDRVNKTARPRQIKELTAEIGDVTFIPFSAEKKEGIDIAIQKIETSL